jgi:hypothetical protein
MLLQATFFYTAFAPLAVAEALDVIVVLITAVCEDRLTAKQLVDFHGKVSVCLHEMFVQGVQIYSDIGTVLRNSKLKAPNV